MVVDSSAISAILFKEAEGPALLRALAGPERKLMSAFTRLEAAVVVEARKGEPRARAFAELLEAAGIDTVPFDIGQAGLALDAWQRYGRGRHPAGLNLGDCVSYALARFTGEALLYKGADFTQTDVVAHGASARGSADPETS
jgi:ribonuclease VapC